MNVCPRISASNISSVATFAVAWVGAPLMIFTPWLSVEASVSAVPGTITAVSVAVIPHLVTVK